MQTVNYNVGHSDAEVIHGDVFIRNSLMLGMATRKSHVPIRTSDKLESLAKREYAERGEQSAREAQSTRQSDKRINSAKTPEDPCLLTWYDLRPAPHTTQAGTRVGGRLGRSGRRDDMDAVRRATAEHNNTSREFAVAGLEGEGREWKSHSIQTVILGRLPQSFIRYDGLYRHI